MIILQWERLCWYLNMTKLISDRVNMLSYLPCRGKVAELGVFRGDFSRQILRVNQPRELHLVDVDISKIDIDWNEDLTEVFIHQMDDLYWLPKYFNYFDWLYIDTLHTYEQTKKELILSHDAIKDSGFICGHDYTHVCAIGPQETWHRYGVIEAVNEFCEEYRYNLLYLTNEPDRFLSYVLQRI